MQNSTIRHTLLCVDQFFYQFRDYGDDDSPACNIYQQRDKDETNGGRFLILFHNECEDRNFLIFMIS